MTAARALTIGFLPWWPANPYQVLLKAELNALGLRVIGNPPLSVLRILLNRDGLDVVHVHWPHGTYQSLGGFLHVLAVLLAYRLRKNNLVWTVHELDAYESKRPRLDGWLRGVLMKLCRRLIVHGEHTRRQVRDHHGFPRPIHVARHPSYQGCYPDTLDRAGARAQLGLAESARVFLYFGYIKPYKGVEELLAAFQGVGDENSVLWVAGKPLDETIERQIEALAGADSRVRLQLGYIPDEAIQVLFRAADLAVFPFRQTQTSGSLMLALTFGCPVIAPALATIPEYVDEDCGFLFDPHKPGDLARALAAGAHADLAGMADSARRRGAQTTWQEMARTHLDCYQAVAGQP